MNLDATLHLRKRKECVEMTLRYVENERRLLEAGADCVGDTPYHQRAWLLDQVTEWYRAELRELDGATSEPPTQFTPGET